MRKVGLLTALALGILAVTGCAARINQQMASWMGSSYSDLVAAWGPPARALDDGAGGKILVYAKTSPGEATTTYDPGIGGTGFMGVNLFGPSSQTTYTPPQVVAYRMFWINSQGRVYRWAWRGL